MHGLVVGTIAAHVPKHWPISDMRCARRLLHDNHPASDVYGPDVASKDTWLPCSPRLAAKPSRTSVRRAVGGILTCSWVGTLLMKGFAEYEYRSGAQSGR